MTHGAGFAGTGGGRMRRAAHVAIRQRLAAAAALALVVCPASRALGYYEDVDTPVAHSTFHYELMRLLARAAGFAVADAELIAVADEAVDLGSFTSDTPGGPTVQIDGTSRLEETTAKYFHFPRRGVGDVAGEPYPGERDTCAYFAGTSEPCAGAGGEVGELAAWAILGTGNLGVPVPSAAVGGGAPAPVAGASLVALAIYLHSLADSYSHEKCMADSQTRKHCLPAKPGCPMSCTTELWHNQAEYGSDGAGVSFTREAARAVWGALREYRAQRGSAGIPLWDDAGAFSFLDTWTGMERGTARADDANSTYGQLASCSLSCSATATVGGPASLAVLFAAAAETSNCTAAPAFAWSFGDGGAQAPGTSVTHTYEGPGTYSWSVAVSAESASCSASGVVTVPAGRVRRHLGRAR